MSIKEIPVLTETEERFVQLFCEEMSTQEIADIMDKSPRTIEAIRDKVKTKFGVISYAGIVLGAIKYGYVKVTNETKEPVDI